MHVNVLSLKLVDCNGLWMWIGNRTIRKCKSHKRLVVAHLTVSAIQAVHQQKLLMTVHSAVSMIQLHQLLLSFYNNFLMIHPKQKVLPLLRITEDTCTLLH